MNGGLGDSVARERAGDRVRADLPRRILVGTCVEWETGRPLAGCRVVTATSIVVTGANGTFELRDADAASDGVVVRVSAPGRLGVAQRIRGSADLGTVRLRRGCRVMGRVRDEHGEPFAGAVVGLRVLGSRRGDGWLERWKSRATAGFDGAFELPEPLPAGSVQVELLSSVPLVGSDRHVLTGPVTVVELVCHASESPQSITGRVVSRDGRGLSGAIVEARRSAQVVASSRSGEDGRFVLHRGRDEAASSEGVELTATVPGLGALARPSSSVPWGARDVTLQMDASGLLGLRVVDAETRGPIERFAVQCVPEVGVRSSADAELRASGRHARGEVWLRDVRRGRNAVIVWPEDPRWLANLPQTVEHDAAGGFVELKLRRAVSCPVKVVDSQGLPIANAEVELVQPAVAELVAAPVREHAALFDHGGIRGAVNVRVARARTDRAGLALLRWWHDPAALEIRVHAPGRPAFVEHGVRLGDEASVICVPDGGRLLVTSDVEVPMRLRLRSANGKEQRPAEFEPPFELQPSRLGQFAIPAGDWFVHVALRLDTADAVTAWSELPAAVARVALAPGEERRLALELRDRVAAVDLQGTALVDGQPAQQIVLLVGEVDSATGAVRGRHTITRHADSRGWFRFPCLRAGPYRLELRLAVGSRQIAVPVTDWMTLTPGQVPPTQSIAIVTAPVRLRVRDATGRPVSGRYVELFARPGIALLTGLDERGVASFERVPAGDYRVRLRAPGSTAIAPVELERLVVTGGAPVERVLRLR
ncbi:MAG: carboxypeptidase-like regulatory domain-containing protein [bacterium]|nr:carboxypeptidase-like regulatory domain-containing protein [bacterium]